MNTVATLAYMAGIVDGEGTITIVATPNPKTGTLGMALRLMVANSNVGLLNWIQDHFGGTVHKPMKVRALNHNPVSMWYTRNKEAAPICAQLLPYLLVKRRRAEILIALSDLKYVYNARGRYVPPEVAAAREPLIAELRALNHRGIAPDAAPDAHAA